MSFRPNHIFSAIIDIKSAFLAEHSIKALTLDLDNALVPYKTRRATPEIIKWLTEMRTSGIKLLVLSNAKQPRVAEFCAPLGLNYIAKAGKPRITAYQSAVKLLGITPEHIAHVGDQIFTDVRGANRSGFISIRVSPIDLSFFPYRLRSWVEKPFLK